MSVKGERIESDKLPSLRARAVISLLVALHLLALVGEPLRMFTQGRQPTAPDAGLIRRGLGPYIDFAYLHHGYFFFAPNPGPSHLMDITLYDADGAQRHLRLPNHRAQWPRLLFHRHFMLSEFLYQLYTPPVSANRPTTPDPAFQQWLSERTLFEQVRSSMEKHLATRYGAARAEIQLMEHRLPNAVEVFDNRIKLNDDQLYILLPDVPTEDGLPPPATSAVGPSSKASVAAPAVNAPAVNAPPNLSSTTLPGAPPSATGSPESRASQEVAQ